MPCTAITAAPATRALHRGRTWDSETHLAIETGLSTLGRLPHPGTAAETPPAFAESPVGAQWRHAISWGLWSQADKPYATLSDTVRLKMAVRNRFIPHGWSSGFTKAARRLVEEATFEFSGAGLKKQILITWYTIWRSIYKKKRQSQDLAAQESMGAIVNRTREHLGTTDKAIITFRRILIDAVRDLQNGIDPPGTDPSTYRNVRSADVMLPKNVRWQDMADQQTARW